MTPKPQKDAFATEFREFTSDISKWAQDSWRHLSGQIPQPQKDAVATEFREFANDISGWAEDCWHRLSGQEQRELSQRFLAWSQKNLDDADLKEWIAGLTDKGVEVLAEQLTRFCYNFDIELNWLIDGRLANYPDLTAVVMQVVLHYCSACKIALDHNEDVQKFQRIDYRNRQQSHRKP